MATKAQHDAVLKVAHDGAVRLLRRLVPAFFEQQAEQNLNQHLVEIDREIVLPSINAYEDNAPK